MPTMPGPVELIVILVIVAMLFGVGKLPEVFGAVGKGIREFRTNVSDEKKSKAVANDNLDTEETETTMETTMETTVESNGGLPTQSTQS